MSVVAIDDAGRAGRLRLFGDDCAGDFRRGRRQCGAVDSRAVLGGFALAAAGRGLRGGDPAADAAFSKKAGNRQAILIAFVFLASGLATLLGVSELLSCMALGAVFCNVSGESDEMADLAGLG